MLTFCRLFSCWQDMLFDWFLQHLVKHFALHVFRIYSPSLHQWYDKNLIINFSTSCVYDQMAEADYIDIDNYEEDVTGMELDPSGSLMNAEECNEEQHDVNKTMGEVIFR